MRKENGLDGLSKVVQADLVLQKQRLNDVLTAIKLDRLSLTPEIVYSDVLGCCRLILDKAMNQVWYHYGRPKAEANKADVYFPCQDIESNFIAALQRVQLGKLMEDNFACFEVIRSTQPFACASNRWLRELFVLTKDKHESYLEIKRRVRRETLLGQGQCGTIKSIVINQDGHVHADADMRDSNSGKKSPLRLDITDTIELLLDLTDKDPMTYCINCIDRVQVVFNEVIATLAPLESKK